MEIGKKDKNGAEIKDGDTIKIIFEDYKQKKYPNACRGGSLIIKDLEMITEVKFIKEYNGYYPFCLPVFLDDIFGGKISPTIFGCKTPFFISNFKSVEIINI